MLQKFSFFSAETKEQADLRNTISYYKSLVKELRGRLKEREHEIDSCFNMNKYYQEELKVVQCQCKKLAAEVESLNDLREKEMEKHRQR